MKLMVIDIQEYGSEVVMIAIYLSVDGTRWDTRGPHMVSCSPVLSATTVPARNVRVRIARAAS